MKENVAYFICASPRYKCTSTKTQNKLFFYDYKVTPIGNKEDADYLRKRFDMFCEVDVDGNPHPLDPKIKRHVSTQTAYDILFRGKQVSLVDKKKGKQKKVSLIGGKVKSVSSEDKQKVTLNTPKEEKPKEEKPKESEEKNSKNLKDKIKNKLQEQSKKKSEEKS